MKFTVGYIKRDDEFLFLYRNKKKNDINKGKYIGVGGHIEPGETPEECMVREAYEETGLKIENPNRLGIVLYEQDDGYTEEMYVFYIDKYTGELHESDEGELGYMTPEEFYKKPHWIGDELFLKYVFENRKFGKFKLKYNKNELVEVEHEQ